MQVDKNISHIHLLDAFEKSKICPICDLNNATVNKYIDDMLYENVNDPTLRKKLINSKGLCPFHGEILIRHGDAMGIAIIHTEQMELLLSHIKTYGSIFLSTKKSDEISWLEHKDCPVCKIRDETERRHIDTFIELIDDKTMRNYLESFPGFCARHLMMILAELKNKEHMKFLIELHCQKYESLLKDLKEFCRKNDYRFKDEKISQGEAESWKKAVHIISGKVP